MNVAERSLQIPADSVVLDADLAVPEPATAAVLFAHGSGSSRQSPRNRFVARELPGALKQVARLAQGWFTQHLKPGPRLLQLVLPG